MNNTIDAIKAMVRAGLFRLPRMDEVELRTFIRTVASSMPPGLCEDEIEQFAREIEFKFVVKAGLGAAVLSGDFEPWLDDAKPMINPFYWNRYRDLLVEAGLPKGVVISTDQVTERILGRLGNPNRDGLWKRHGMVVGHVQSGKTANYTGLVCKAADAGYRLIIVIGGIHNNLRSQTQERIDEGLIGFDSGRQRGQYIGGRKYVIGAGKSDPSRKPVCLTTRVHDFSKARADTDSSRIEDYVEPVVLVIKKNYRTLANLLDWLKDNSARGDQEMIDQPMLLIDDEADNASINTKYGKKLVTKINGQIRDLLNLFRRSCYVGYTATPFANIFIDPDQDDEIYNEDLFPRDFIIGLDAPSNYFGPTKIFDGGLPDEDKPVWLRYITDNEDVLPIRHKIDHELVALPNSLITALRAFLLSRSIRNLRGHHSSHCSMLVNASRFTAVQGHLRNYLHEALERIQNSVRINASRGAMALNDPEIAELYAVWKEEYSDTEPNWASIQAELFDSIASAKVVEVNSRANDLDYSQSGTRGQTVIAVGGFSLSRGITLEGLTVTWFLRNTLMYDTLMQMGRWFGYRDGYEDLCRIWMPPEAIDWYAFITNAAEELHDELRTMEKANATPKMFGLAVRSHPASLLVTARNKMGAGKKVTTLIGLSNKFVETARVSIIPDDLRANLEVAKSFVAKLNAGNSLDETKTPWGTLVRDVPVEYVDEFLAGWRNAEQSVTTDPRPVRRYIHARKFDELQRWDVLFASLNLNRGKPDLTLGRPFVPASRYVDPHDLKQGFISFSGKRMRVASRGVEKAGVDPAKAAAAEMKYRQDKGKSDGDQVNYPDSIYRRQRDRGLFILHFVRATSPVGKKHATGTELIPSAPVVAWGISLPASSRRDERVEYVVNPVRYQELFGEEDDDDQEASLEAA